MGVLLPINGRFLSRFADRQVYDPFRELVHIAWARKAGFHTCEYGRSRTGLQNRSCIVKATPMLKLSHYRLVGPHVVMRALCYS